MPFWALIDPAVKRYQINALLTKMQDEAYVSGGWSAGRFSRQQLG
jgi:hypothetical protein